VPTWKIHAGLSLWSLEMTDWGRLLVRSFGVLHLVYGAIGTLFLLDALVRISRNNIQFGKYPYERQVYFFNIGLEVLFVGALIIAGVRLIHLSRRGVILSNCVFLIEIASWLAYSWFSLGLTMHGGRAAALGMSMGAVAGIGGMGTAAQLVTGYPLIALVGLNIARRHLDRQGTWSKPAPTPS
jgi:hypothetical protein